MSELHLYYATASTSAALAEHTPETQARVIEMLASQALNNLLKVVPVPYKLADVMWSFNKALGWWAEPDPPEWPERTWVEGPWFLQATIAVES